MQDRINQLKCSVYDRMVQIEQYQIEVSKLQKEVQEASAEIADLQAKVAQGPTPRTAEA